MGTHGGAGSGAGMISLQTMMEMVRASEGVLPEPLAGHLFAAAVACAADANVALRPSRVALASGEGLSLVATSTDEAGAHELAYLAPEARDGGVPGDDPRVLVYAAGALGYELLTGNPPPAQPALIARAPGPLGGVVRIALSPQAFARFSTLGEMRAALEVLRPAPHPELERLLFTAMHARCARRVRHGARRENSEPRKAGPTVEALAASMQRLNTSMEDLQRQQLELIAALASQDLVRAAPAAETAPRQREHLELLHRIAVMSAATPAPATQGPRRAPLWLVWGGAALVSAAIAAAVSLVILTAAARDASHSSATQSAAADETPARVESRAR